MHSISTTIPDRKAFERLAQHQVNDRGPEQQQAPEPVRVPTPPDPAVARWQPEGATLQQGERTFAYAHMDELTEQLTGAALPLPALFQWLRGLASEVPGWSADLSGHSDGRILAQRLTPLPRAELRIRLQP